ncbi:MAG: carboxymuconolactone decarboxylase family protein [Acidimicrobiia bacterium]
MARIDVPAGEGDEAVRLWMLRPEMAVAIGTLSDAAYKESKLPTRERECVRMRIAQINDCPI